MTTDQVWMLAMLAMFGLFLRGLQSEARRALKAIAHDEHDGEWRSQMQLVMAQQQARQRLRAMREEAARQEAERQARLSRALWERRRAEAIDESRAPAHERPALSSLESRFGFAHIGDVIDEDELYSPFRLFGERIGALAETGGVERSGARRAEPVSHDFPQGGARLPVTRERN
jgi:hypothetical protein